MNISTRQLKLCVFVLAIQSATFAVGGATITITPATPSLLVGQTLQLTANGAVAPSEVAAGGLHTCVRFSDQSVRCVGFNSQGELGDGTLTATSTPVLVQALTNPVSIRTGMEHTCSLIGDGTMRCWGQDYTGALGDGRMGNGVYSAVPVAVQGMSNATAAIVDGGFHTCAILSDNSVKCWGRNQDGQIGNGDSTTDVATPVPVTGLGSVVGLTAGGYHTCALMPDHSIRCWGRNGRGQVGNGNSNSPIVTPTPVSGMTTAVSVSAGGYHTCAVLSDGTVQCWGQSDWGQIGAPGLAFSSVPVTVSGITNAVAVKAGFLHTCAALADGSVWCWGANDLGQLGDGATTNSATPVRIASIVNPIALSAGGSHTCVLMQDHSVWCWGENSHGELGIGTFTNSPTPSKMNGTGLVWTSSDPSVASIDASGLVAGISRGTTTITASDAFGNTGSTTLTVRTLVSLAVVRQGDGNGTVTSNPVGISCGTTCSGSYPSDSQVTLAAAPGVDSIFSGWTGCDSVSGATCTVTMTNTRSVTAIFMLKRFTLSATKSGVGTGIVASSPGGINCGSACSSDFVIGSTITLTASPSAGSVFLGWTGCDAVSNGTCTVTMNAARSIVANFDLQRFSLGVTITKTLFGNGTVTSSPAGINCGADCSEAYVIGTIVTLTANPALGSVLTGWTGCNTTSGSSCTVTMSAQKSVSASFTGVLP